MRLVHVLASVVLLSSSPAFAETLTNGSIVILTAAGLGDQAVIAKIESSDAAFDTSTKALVSLRRQGVSGAVIAAMIGARGSQKTPTPIAAPLSPSSNLAGLRGGVQGLPRAVGIYIVVNGNSIRIDPTTSGQMKTGGILGSALTLGIASASMKIAIDGETARIRTGDRQPLFYFNFGAAASNSSPFGQGMTTASPSSPNEFQLVRLTQKKGRREARIGSFNVGGAKMGVMDKDRVSFDYQEVRSGLFSVRALISLPPGEYGFVATSVAGAAGSRIFEFSVQ